MPGLRVPGAGRYAAFVASRCGEKGVCASQGMRNRTSEHLLETDARGLDAFGYAPKHAAGLGAKRADGRGIPASLVS